MKKFNWRGLLKEHSLFTGLNEKEVGRIIDQLVDDKVSQEREYTERQIIVREGELSDSAFLLGSGSVEVILQGPYGLETTVSNLRPGEFFGEMALLEKKPRAATVKAKERSILLEIKGQEFLKLLDEHRDVESKMLLKLSERLRYANEQVVSVKLKGINEQLDGFNVKLDAELKAVDASLKAALAVFDQTNTRTNEIINSADRNRTRLSVTTTVVSGVLSAVLAIFGWLGWDTFQKINDMYKNTVANAEFVQQKKDDVEKAVAVSQNFHDVTVKLVRNVFLPFFEKALEENRDYDALELYHNIRFLNPLMDVDDILNRIQVKIFDRPDGDYTALLQAIQEDTKDPELRIKSGYLLLVNAILTNKFNPNNLQPPYDATFTSLTKFVETHKDKRIDKNDFALLEKLFQQRDTQKQKAFNRVKLVFLKP